MQSIEELQNQLKEIDEALKIARSSLAIGEKTLKKSKKIANKLLKYENHPRATATTRGHIAAYETYIPQMEDLITQGKESIARLEEMREAVKAELASRVDG